MLPNLEQLRNSCQEEFTRPLIIPKQPEKWAFRLRQSPEIWRSRNAHFSGCLGIGHNQGLQDTTHEVVVGHVGDLDWIALSKAGDFARVVEKNLPIDLWTLSNVTSH